jgi:hypothetical protein
MPARKPTALRYKKWTAQANLQLLLTIIQTYKVKINYAEIAAILGDVSGTAEKSQHNNLKSGCRGNFILHEPESLAVPQFPSCCANQHLLDEELCNFRS